VETAGQFRATFGVSHDAETKATLNICRIPRRNRHYSGETPTPRKPAQWLAGTAVRIAPCSAEIPCKQGILQGNSADSGNSRDFCVQIAARFNALAAFPYA